MRYEQRHELAKQIAGNVAGISASRIARIIEAVEALGWRLHAPNEPVIQGIVLTEQLKRDAQDALVNWAIDTERDAIMRAQTMRTAMRRRAGAVRNFADIVRDARTLDARSAA